jgi:hypothetical protein
VLEAFFKLFSPLFATVLLAACQAVILLHVALFYFFKFFLNFFYLFFFQLVADESLLMYTIQESSMTQRQKLDQFQVIVKEMTRTLTCHRSVSHLHSLEAFLAFVRSVFMISLTLAFSPVSQDADLARFLEKLSLELYSFMCHESAGDDGPTSPTLTQTAFSVRMMNSALALLGLSALEGSADIEERKEEEKKWSEVENKKKKEEEGGRQEEVGNVPDGEKRSSEGKVSSSSSSSLVTSSISSVSSPSDLSSKSGELASSSQSHADSEPAAKGSGNNPSQENASDQSKSPSSMNEPTKEMAHTFPATSKAAKSFLGGRQRRVEKRGGRKFVGLNMTRDDLIAATCPPLAEGVSLAADEGEDDGAEKLVVDMESLHLSAQTFASASAIGSDGGRASVVDHSPVVRDIAMSAHSKADGDGKKSVSQESKSSPSSKSSCLSSSSHGEREKIGEKNNTTGSGTVDRSSTTQGTSSATTASIAGNVGDVNSSFSSSSGPKYIHPGSVSLRGSEKPGSSSSSSSNVKSSSSATVDPSAETEPSTTSDSTNGKDLPPLVDISSACSIMSDLHLGDSVETSDSGEFLANFTPSDNKDVHSEFLFSF